MRGVLVAEEDNIKSYYIDVIFNTIWQDGLNMNDEIVIQKVLKNINVNPKHLHLDQLPHYKRLPYKKNKRCI